MTDGELSYFGIEPGFISEDGTVIVGRAGYLFVLRGSNDLDRQYSASVESPEIRSCALRWRELLTRRRERLAQIGVSFQQLIIAEKSSILHDCFPRPLPVETPLFAAVRAQLEGGPEPYGYVDVNEPLRRHERRDELFRKMDSHLTPFGTLAVFRTMAAALRQPDLPEITFSGRLLLQADLGRNLFRLPFKEPVSLPVSPYLDACGAQLELVERDSPESKHVGTRMVWRNAGSPSPLRVVAFANSFFERGAGPSGLSWWAARYFREFHFIWSPILDYGYVESVRPDAVICQAIERFLPIVPQD